MRRYTFDDFIADSGVSREIGKRLQLYAGLVVKWQAAVNLVGPKTIPDLWRRHFFDSAQLLGQIDIEPDGWTTLLDVGSGAGFPGLVLAICRPDLDVHLIDSDARKGTFLREVIRQTGTRATVHTGRIETVEPFPVAWITGRACAPLGRFLALVEPFLSSRTVCLLHKGARVERELTDASKQWKMRVARVPSRTAASGMIVRLTEVARARNPNDVS